MTTYLVWYKIPDNNDRWNYESDDPGANEKWIYEPRGV